MKFRFDVTLQEDESDHAVESGYLDQGKLTQRGLDELESMVEDLGLKLIGQRFTNSNSYPDLESSE